MDLEKPEYLGVVFDAKGPTVRHEEFEAYKAHRKPMPEDLAIQLPVLKDVLRALKIATAEYPKYEADDALASLAARAAAKGIRTVIVTTDKDLLQAVDAWTTVWNPAKEITVDESNVKDIFGVAAGQVVDVLALWGDPTDNVPGVPGIGEKTAKSLIREFGSLDNLLGSRTRASGRGSPRTASSSTSAEGWSRSPGAWRSSSASTVTPSRNRTRKRLSDCSGSSNSHPSFRTS
jgi:DNA polymerase-1